MKNEFIPYEQALTLREIGYIGETFGFYWTDTTQLVYDNAIGNHKGVHLPAPSFRTYEQAELACLKKLIEIIKTK